LGALGLGESIVDIVGREEADAGMVVLGVVPGKEIPTVARACSSEPKRSGKSERYFMVLKCSENGLSSETWGREWLLVTPLRSQ
jgi:hypothetical protein